VRQIHNLQDEHEEDRKMYLEFRHLRTIKAIHQAGGLARAADMLNMTQSALSHQVKGLEDQAGVELFVRRSKPLRLSAAGVRMLRAAERILPELDALAEEFRALRSGKTGRLHIAIECHACFDWLFPVLTQFRHAWAEVDVDIRAGLSFEAMPALLREDVDLVITSEPTPLAGVTYHALFDYHPTFVCAAGNALAAKDRIEAEDFRDQVLITYPVGRDKLDVFTELLTPARVEPAGQRMVELTAVILMLVAANRGVSVLPDWVLREVRTNADYVTRPLGDGTITKRLYAATREDDATKPFMAHFLRLGRSEPVKMQR
jgi:LysR family transcriptional regulator, regulator for metE and metH